MLKKLLGKLLAWRFGKALLVPVAEAYGKLKGYKTEILWGVTGAVYTLELFGLLPEGTTTKVVAVLGPASVPTLLEKLKDHEEVVKAVIEKSKKK